jgi:HD-GYP domain-containing protein (c-di-GMP phosphodiesterase class II)
MIHPTANKDDIVQAGLGGMLHDLGKIKIPTFIINNPGKLSDEDFEQIKKHPDHGHDLLCKAHCDLGGVNLKNVKRAVHEHHENYNGTGYPNKLEGMEIHKLARITAIADFFDAITTKRSYHDVLPIDKALGVMANTVGKKIDPKYFAIFKNNAHDVVKKSPLTLPDSFDPCQPCNVLPFIDPKKDKKKLDMDKDRNIGKVNYDGDLFGKNDRKKGA